MAARPPWVSCPQQNQMRAKPQVPALVRQRAAVHQFRPRLGQGAFAKIREFVIQLLRQDELQHSVAEKFQPLIVLHGSALFVRGKGGDKVVVLTAGTAGQPPFLEGTASPAAYTASPLQLSASSSSKPRLPTRTRPMCPPMVQFHRIIKSVKSPLQSLASIARSRPRLAQPVPRCFRRRRIQSVLK